MDQYEGDGQPSMSQGWSGTWWRGATPDYETGDKIAPRPPPSPFPMGSPIQTPISVCAPIMLGPPVVGPTAGLPLGGRPIAIVIPRDTQSTSGK